MSPCDLQVAQAARCFPRVSGDEPTPKIKQGGATWFSPRERG